MSEELKKIKKYYGENMMHLCRELFPTLLEQEGILIKLLEENFEHTKFLYEDIIENKIEEQFKNYIYSLVDVEQKEIKVVDKTPQELLKEVGYNLYECKTEEEIQSFRKYYKEDERLCTFNRERLNDCYVFFAVKENVEEIKRENFSNPKRQDEYGTSVISIQFSRGSINTLSIKNRYNHTVNNPDATYSNNLENIKEGLTRSFEKKYNLNINQNDNVFELPGYVKANDGRYYKYNYEINNIYYCPNNIIIDNNEVIKDYEEKEKYLVIDYFILDLQNKEINLYDKTEDDSFIDGIENISKIEVIKKEENKIINITTEEDNKITIEIDKRNRIIGYSNEKITEIGSGFLYYNKTLKSINLPNVIRIGYYFLSYNNALKNIHLPKVIKIGLNFLYYNEVLESINLPKVIKIGNGFLYYNKVLESIDLPKVKEIDDGFLYYNNALKNINLPNVEKIGDYFLYCNTVLTSINILNVKKICTFFLYNNKVLESIYMQKIEEIGYGFLAYNNNVNKKETINNGNRKNKI